MPTYRAVGVKATLSVASLESCRTQVFDLRMSPQQKADAKRVEEIFARGRNLPEQPASDDDVMQFLGKDEDLPFFMVEAGNDLPSHGCNVKERMAEEATAMVIDPLLLGNDTDSPLTSLGATPTCSFDGLGTPFESPAKPSVAPPKPQHRRTRGQQKSKSTQNSTFSGFDQAKSFLDTPAAPQALALAIELKNKFYRKDLKIEVFINGQLAAVSFVNDRGSAVELKDKAAYTFRFHGTRVHRQMERSWVYRSGQRSDSESEHLTAAERWSAIGEALDDEARLRGRNRWGDCPPSAELLVALSELELPAHLTSSNDLSVIDLIITIGKGRKYGPDTAYLNKPTRMDDPAFSTTATDPFADDNMLFNTTVNMSPLRNQAQQPAPYVSSPEVPLKQQHAAVNFMPETPTKKKGRPTLTESFPDLELEGIDLKKQLSPHESTRGKPTRSQRNLGQRLSDIKQMNQKNREKAVAALREELGEDEIRAIKEKVFDFDKEPCAQPGPSPNKRARLNSFDFGLNMLADTALTQAGGEATMDPMKVWRAAPAPVLLPEGAEPEAMLAQTRIDMALSAGADSNGALLRRIASTSPKRTPSKKTRASALANSPCAVPVKEQRRGNPKPETPTQQGNDIFHPHLGSPIPLDPVLTPKRKKDKPNDDGSPKTPGSGNKRSGRGANRIASKWDPNEMTAQEALKAFQVPELCKGGVVGYADAECERQVGKARGGEFVEEQVLVGMRFVVV